MWLMFGSNSNSNSNVADVDQSKIFNMILLGTDTDREHPTTRMPGYQAGELLNGIERSLVGEEFKDKHILSGAKTTGGDVDTRVAEAFWMTLKAISEGKTVIKVAAHSRGGVQAILLANAIERMMSELQNANEANFKSIIEKIKLGYIHAGVKNACKQNGDDISFETNQRQLDANGKVSVISKTHTFKISQLVSAIKQSDLSNKFHMELFIIDPVPGQGNWAINNWTTKKFFIIPNIVKKARFIYKEDERSSFFEPIIPRDLPKYSDIKFISLPGNHGTASGFLTEQDRRSPTAIADDDDVPRYVDQQGEPVKVGMSDGIILNDKIKRVDKKGKKTRHVQKLVSAMLVEFFGEKSFLAPKPADLVRDKSGEIPPITKAISRRIKFFNRIDEYKLKMYKKIHDRRNEYVKLRDSCYINLPGVPGRVNPLHLEYRKVLTGLKTAAMPYTAAHPSLGGAHVAHVNDDHFQLHLQHEYQVRLRQEILTELQQTVMAEAELSRKRFDAEMAVEFEKLKVKSLELAEKETTLSEAQIDLQQKKANLDASNMARNLEHQVRVAAFEEQVATIRERLSEQQQACHLKMQELAAEREKLSRENLNIRSDLNDATDRVQAESAQVAKMTIELNNLITMNRQLIERTEREYQAKVLALTAEREEMLLEVQEKKARLSADERKLVQDANANKQAQEQAVAQLAGKLASFQAAEANLALQQEALQDQLNVLDARHDSIKSLDLQISCFERTHSNDHAEATSTFVAALKMLRSELNADIQQQVLKGKKNISNSTAVKISEHTTDMLMKLQLPNSDKLSVMREFENRCKQVPGWQKFARVICAVCMAGVGFILGAVIGMAIGIAAGAWTGPGVFVTAAIGLAAGAAKGAAIGVTAGAACLGIASGFGSGALLFKPTGVRKQALNVINQQLRPSPSPAA